MQAHALHESSFQLSPSCLGQNSTFNKRSNDDRGGGERRKGRRIGGNTRPVGFAGVGARRSNLLDLGALGAATTRQSDLMLGRAVVHRASLSNARDGGVGAAAPRALVQVELHPGVVDAGAEHARALWRRQVPSAACVRREKTRHLERDEREQNAQFFVLSFVQRLPLQRGQHSPESWTIFEPGQCNTGQACFAQVSRPAALHLQVTQGSSVVVTDLSAVTSCPFT